MRSSGGSAPKPTNITLSLVGLLSVSLGVFNLFPIPALDGGRILFTLHEILFKKRIPTEWENMVNGIAMLVLIALLYGVQGSGYAPRRWLITAMVGLWGLRLVFYLLRDRVIGHAEEGRYQQLRRVWKTNLPLKFFLFFQWGSNPQCRC